MGVDKQMAAAVVSGAGSDAGSEADDSDEERVLNGETINVCDAIMPKAVSSRDTAATNYRAQLVDDLKRSSPNV